MLITEFIQGCLPDTDFPVTRFGLWFAKYVTFAVDSLDLPANDDVVLSGQSGVWDIDYVKEKDWLKFISSEDPEIPLPEELSLEEKVERMWAAHQELHI